MKIRILPKVLVLAAGLMLFLPVTVRAFPPAPHHVIYGLVRDELGQPLNVSAATIIFETLAGVQIRSDIFPSVENGINYRLTVPMDAGLTAGIYKPTALSPTVPFRVKVQIGTATYVPIEMTGNFASLGQPAKKTRIDLTLGEDKDGDGIPDAWERMMISRLGGGLTLADIRGADDLDHDGLSNYAEYIAGTYAFDPVDGFRLEIVGLNKGAPLLDFLAIRGRTYAVYGSSDLKTWTPVGFRIPAEGPIPAVRQNYQATDVRNLRVEVVPPEGANPNFFKVQVQ